MGKGRKQASPAIVVLQGTLAALGIYLLFQLLLALLLVKGVLPETSMFPSVAAACVLAAFTGGLVTAGRIPWGTLAGGMLCACGFGAVLVLVGLGFWEGVTWTGRGGILLLCVLAGGVLAGLLGSKRGRRVKKRAKRR